MTITSDFINKVKECLSIVGTIKDDEIVMWINAGISDMERQGVDVASNFNDSLIQGCIVMYIKANFGFVEESEKEIANKRYLQTITNLSLSQSYLEEVEE